MIFLEEVASCKTWLLYSIYWLERKAQEDVPSVRSQFAGHYNNALQISGKYFQDMWTTLGKGMTSKAFSMMRHIE